jgi:hypothetical protein
MKCDMKCGMRGLAARPSRPDTPLTKIRRRAPETA